jgi:NAD(P)-dependent dehydrogenase (short-subunit alcohol dehydrogenase family)
MAAREEIVMARLFITGSSDGLGRMAAQLLVEQGHSVVLHARNEERAKVAKAQVPQAEGVVVGDFMRLADVREVARQANALGIFDAVIHNAAVGYQEPRRMETADGLEHVFAVNTLAPYMLTALIRKPKRLVYLSSMLHKRGDASLKDLNWEKRKWDGTQAYSDSKLHDLMLAFAVARLWPDVLSNALEPGWVATKMGGPGATDDLNLAHRTQVWLAASDNQAATVTGEYFYHQQRREPLAAARDTEKQDQLLKECEKFTGVQLPLAAAVA